MNKQTTTSLVVLSGAIWLGGCALPQGAVSVNTDISASMRAQQVEFEKAMEWAFEPYYNRLSAAKPMVLAKAIEIEKISLWRKQQTETIWLGMQSGTVSAVNGTSRLEAITTQVPNEEQLESMSLPVDKVSELAEAVHARYLIAREELDEEKNSVISQLRENSNNIISANDTLTRALEVSGKNVLRSTQLARTILSVVAPKLPGIETLAQLVEKFEQSAASTASSR